MGRAQMRLERVFKGVASHRRIEILQLLEREPDLSLSEVSQRLRIELANASEHLRKLGQGGLIHKNKRGREVRHIVSDRGQQMLAFIKQL